MHLSPFYVQSDEFHTTRLTSLIAVGHVIDGCRHVTFGIQRFGESVNTGILETDDYRPFHLRMTLIKTFLVFHLFLP